jgi:hypothetical protein
MCLVPAAASPAVGTTATSVGGAPAAFERGRLGAGSLRLEVDARELESCAAVGTLR